VVNAQGRWFLADVLAGAALAIILTIAAPGLAIVAVVVIVVFLMLAAWFATEALLRRRRARTTPGRDRREAPPRAER
jgi:hypothetical protein